MVRKIVWNPLTGIKILEFVEHIGQWLRIQRELEQDNSSTKSIGFGRWFCPAEAELWGHVPQGSDLTC